MTVHLHTIAPWEVEPGDLLLGLRTPVARILYDGFDGRWLYADVTGVIIAARQPGMNVQVLRDTDDDDDCPPWGIPRPLEAVRRRGPVTMIATRLAT